MAQLDMAIAKIRWKRRTINALLIRELMQRFGHGNIGFMWLVGEPLILTAGVMIAWSFIYGEENHGVKVIPLVLTGYSMLTVWRHMVARFTHSFRHNSGLLFHRTVRPIDILIARGVLECIGTLIAFFVAYVPLRLLEYITPIDDYLVLLTAWFLMCALTFGVALTISCLTELSDTLERFVQPIMYLLLPLTGAFYMVSWLPETARHIVLLSPMVHANEMFRGGFFGAEVPTYWDVSYLALWALATNAVGWSLVRKAQDHIEIE
ncbi:ABC transporter permease [Ensifer adhaerens]|uniref:ABC transporter permease n=1 Tax=Ensifer adhaerens TaxID=106592 RepID=UPI000CF03733|nr:ABC transporter permease [Ensifer adhaerens]